MICEPPSSGSRRPVLRKNANLPCCKPNTSLRAEKLRLGGNELSEHGSASRLCSQSYLPHAPQLKLKERPRRNAKHNGCLWCPTPFTPRSYSPKAKVTVR